MTPIPTKTITDLLGRAQSLHDINAHLNIQLGRHLHKLALCMSKVSKDICRRTMFFFIKQFFFA